MSMIEQLLCLCIKNKRLQENYLCSPIVNKLSQLGMPYRVIIFFIFSYQEGVTYKSIFYSIDKCFDNAN